MFYIQHGYGKSTKIWECIRDGAISGVILSPGHEDVATLIDTARTVSMTGTRVLIDPQSYIYSTNPQGQLRHHEAQGLRFSNLHWALTASDLASIVGDVRSINERSGVPGPWIAPAPFHRSLVDYWVPLSVQLARTAQQEWVSGAIATLAIDESTLSDWDRVADWLDALTTLDVQGFYVIVSRRLPSYPPLPWENLALTNLLRLIYTLAVVNEYQLYWGYADVDGLLGIAAGATAVAAGWTYGLRQFGVERYSEQRAGGAPAVPRVYAPGLLSDLRYNEAGDIYNRTQLREQVFAQPILAEFENRDFSSLTNPQAQVLHLVGLSRDVFALGSITSTSERLDALQARLQHARRTFEMLASAGLALDPRHRARIESYELAVSAFRREVAR
ncbi:hypothetical protein L1785_02675 [Antribacter sp. KLBMP9083]|uniref:Uncharacterized protein n=1 Tax=Antribacter soli TaxID=2910976 RepID=A0AA41QCZ1_9MICO|nr:hypothetical protein [Antribacter soli]MCF4119874.1 hypothetical protein [Antribacter soli]